MITDKQAWKMVAEFGWPLKTSEEELAKKVEFIKNHPNEQERKEFKEWVRKQASTLTDVIIEYEDKHNVSCGPSSDGFSDLVYHIIGLGEREFNATIKDPSKAIKRGNKNDYQESFAYCLHFEQVIENINPQKYVDKAKRYLDELHKEQKVISNPNEYNRIINLLISVTNGDFSLIPDWKKADDSNDYFTWGQMLVNHYAVPNLVIDYNRSKKYFDKQALENLKTYKVEQNRRELNILMLNQKLLKSLENPVFRKHFITQNFVPFNQRSDKEIEELVKVL